VDVMYKGYKAGEVDRVTVVYEQEFRCRDRQDRVVWLREETTIQPLGPDANRWPTVVMIEGALTIDEVHEQIIEAVAERLAVLAIGTSA